MRIWAGRSSVSIAVSAFAPVPLTIQALSASSAHPIRPQHAVAAKSRADEKSAAALGNQRDQTAVLHDELAAVRSENARLRAAVAQLGSQVADGSSS